MAQTKTNPTYTPEDVAAATLEYFGGDDLAANVWQTKYALKDTNGALLERIPSDMHHRLAREFARIERLFDGKRPLQEDELFDAMDRFKYVVPQGSPMYGIGNDHVNVSISNCVVAPSPDDSISSIMDTAKTLANLFKRRCGVGVDISPLRPDGAHVKNAAGTSTGAWSFADLYSFVSRMIGQDGRRGALMITMDIRHPDAPKFAVMKHDATKVTGANISLRITDEFMRAVEADSDFTLRWPIEDPNPMYSSTIRARDLWNTIVDSATKTADPGLLMWDNITNMLPAHCYDGFKTSSTNPCGEVPLSDLDSCRLISLNLKSFVKNPFTSEAYFDFVEFAKMVRIAMRMSDDLVELECEKIERILSVVDESDERAIWTRMLEAARQGRRTGLGTHGLADALARMMLRYDTDEAIEQVDLIYAALRDEAYRESIQLARERGAFPSFNWETERGNAFICSLPRDIREDLKKYGRRNISILTNAPTGSVSIVSQTSSGLEPVFRNAYMRRRKLNHSEQHLEPDFVDDMGDKWQEYKVHHHNVKEWIDLHEGDEDLPDYFITSDEIDAMRRLDVQAAIQRNIDHSISSTINLPQGTQPEVVGELYLEGWRKGLKGLTVYVEGSKQGVLVSNRSDDLFPTTNAPRRPEILECDIHHTTVKGEKMTILVGLLDGKPYETLGGLAELVEIPKKFDKGRLIKRKFKTQNNKYDLHIGENGSEFIIKDVVKVFDNPNNAVLTRLISLGLRHGAGMQFVVEQLQKDRDSDMFSFAKCVARVLKSYIQDGTKCSSDKACPTCDAEGGLVYREGCVVCMSCGWTKCM